MATTITTTMRCIAVVGRVRPTKKTHRVWTCWHFVHLGSEVLRYEAANPGYAVGPAPTFHDTLRVQLHAFARVHAVAA